MALQPPHVCHLHGAGILLLHNGPFCRTINTAKYWHGVFGEDEVAVLSHGMKTNLFFSTAWQHKQISHIPATPAFTESQNHRMAGVGRDLCGSSSPTPLPKQGHLQQAAQDLVREGLDSPSLEIFYNLSGQPVPVLWFWDICDSNTC